MHLCLLSMRRERPHRGRTAEYSDELATPHVHPQVRDSIVAAQTDMLEGVLMSASGPQAAHKRSPGDRSALRLNPRRRNGPAFRSTTLDYAENVGSSGTP